MNRERAETFMRLLAETELRAAREGATFISGAPWSGDSPATSFPRLARVAQALTAVHAIDVAAAQEVLANFAIAVGVRQHSDPGPLLLTRPALTRGRLYARAWWGPPDSGPGAAGVSAGGVSAGGVSAGGPDCYVPLGLTVPFRYEDVSGEVNLLSYAHTPAGARFTVTWRTRSPAGQALMGRHFGGPAVPRLFTVSDDRGNWYQLSFSFTDWSGEIRLEPDPPDGLRWLELSAPGQKPVRIDLPERGAEGPGGAGPQVTPTEKSAGEQMLTVFADRLLMAVGEHGPDLRWTSYARAPLHAMTAGLGDVVAALEAAEVLPPHSQVPGQLAALCASLSVTGHGLATPPGPELPERWLSLLSHYQRRKPDMTPAREGHAPLAIALPEFDGLRVALLGLHNTDGQTMLHLLVGGLPEDDGTGAPIVDNLPVSVWLRDSGGRWHVAGVDSVKFADGEYWLRLKLRPALARSTAWIEVLVAGRSAEICATLPLNWGYPP
ncbi:MAG TPA: hypothetical protein VIX15_00375 [Streptosporangiaceae bacterium]